MGFASSLTRRWTGEPARVTGVTACASSAAAIEDLVPSDTGRPMRGYPFEADATAQARFFKSA